MSKKGKWGYWSDLQSLQLSGGASAGADPQATWIMAMPFGTYTHPVYGEVTLDKDRAKQFVANVNNKVRGQDLDIDYDHKEYGGEAAGWVQQAEVRSDGLWLLVDWTKKAYELIKNKAYRYFSPEFNDEWTHPKTGQKFQNVLFGGAITNRPFLKDILPINMKELIEGGDPTPTPVPTNEPPKEGEGEMDPKLLRLLLQLKEDATDEEVATKLAELAARAATPPTPTPEPTLPKLDINNPTSVTEALRQLTELNGNPAVKALTELVEAQQTQIKKYDKERRELLVERKLSSLDDGKTFSVPPVVRDRLREIMLESPDDLGEQVFQAYKQTLEIGVIDMTERGWQRRGGEASPTQQYLTAIDEMMTANKGMTYAEATLAVGRQNPTLAQQYREDSYIPAEGR